MDNIDVNTHEEKLTVSELSQGLSLICWEACDRLLMLTHDPVTWSMWSDIFSYQEHNYQLSMYFREGKVLLQMIVLGNSKGEIVEDFRLKKVTAFHQGQKVEMQENKRAWGPSYWKSNLTVSPDGTCSPRSIFQLIIEHQCHNNVQENARKLSHFSKLLDTQHLSDVQFVVQWKSFAAHLAILAAASPVMAAMFESGNSTKEIDDVEPEVFEQVLRYLYTGVAPQLKELTESLLVAADKFQINELKEECEVHLVSQLTVENVVQHLLLAHRHTAARLLDGSLEFLSVNHDEVWDRPEWKELSKKHTDLFFKATRKMCDKLKHRAC